MGKVTSPARRTPWRDMDVVEEGKQRAAANRRASWAIDYLRAMSDEALAALIRAAHVELDRRDPVGAEAARRARTNGDNDGGAA